MVRHRATHRHIDRKLEHSEDLAKDIWNSLHQHDRRQRGGDDSEEEEEEEPPRGGGATTIVRTVIQTLPPNIQTVTEDADDATTTTRRVASTTTTNASHSTIMSLGPPIAGDSDDTTTSRTNTLRGSLTTRLTSASTTATTTIPSFISDPTKSSVHSNLAVDTNTPFVPAAPTRSSDSDRVARISPTVSADASKDSGSSGNNAATTAGIVMGVLAGLLLIGLAIFFVFNRRKKQLKQERLDDDEKFNDNPFGSTAAAVAAAAPAPQQNRSAENPRAPRLSLRPVTQFLPNLNFGEKRLSKGANIALAPAAGAAANSRNLAPAQNPWERPITSESANPNNPFGHQAERLPTAISEEPGTPMTEKPLPPGPMDLAGPSHDDPSTAHAVTTGAAAGAGGLTRKASTRKDGPKALDLTLPAPMSAIPPSPVGTEFSVSSEAPDQSSPPPSSSAAAIAAAGGPANSTVHRVQLDFKPTLDDEMELKAGQLVRLLHEYDDGWALCIRLDRSQQGVVPRTCLSTRPVKPRPQNGGPRGPSGPPRGPGPNHPQGQRPMTPQGHPGPHGPPRGPPRPRPESPMRPMGGPGRPHSPAGRPMSPAGVRGMSPGPRSQSPGPRYQGPPGPRSQSPSGMGRNQSPAGRARGPQPGRMNPGGSPPQPSPLSPRPGTSGSTTGPPAGPIGRKPVPGQAM